MSAAIHQDSTLSSPRISPFDGLSPAQAQVIGALAQGGTVTAAAVTQARQDYAYAVAEQRHQLSAQAWSTCAPCSTIPIHPRPCA